MKLELSRVVQERSRLGVLKGLGRTGQHSLEIPGCVLYTHFGTVPHLTQDTLHTLSNLPSVTQVTLSNIAEHQEVLEEFKDGFRKFAGLHDTLLYCSLHDPAAPFPTGYTTNKTVSVWGSGGRIELTVAKFMALQKTVQPDWYQSMADGETWQNTSRKRVRKSVDRTLAHLDECLLVHQNSQELKGVKVFGVVEGGDILEERVRSARETAKRPVAGFCLDGLQTGSMEQALRTQLITAVTKELPEDKPRLLQGVGRPDEVLACVEAGVDLFDSFFPFQVTERGCALCFSFDISLDLECAGRAPPAVLELNDDERDTAGETQQSGDLNLDDQTQMTSFEINLKDKRYRDDFRPLVEGCGCYCCENHQRAYLHHLLVTNELLAGVLLMIHNTAHYHGFFSTLREALSNDKLDLLKRRVLRERGGQRERKD
ncbi:queuine tRNA-ribosyltransferase accessory subunit 2 isoform X4 [Xiphias gladius]|nr:queuine tRNA-ribosyltransferase accessory subunit 2 isoform X4 [Xiphias gladius]XP_039982691.1 queuine tRNA-ribosyltransferase accessory subunit 2 isoform X4 [Xiphias gladius]XP_039982692.1 queuine tRNA-ribosyltransferase accessory subunit 2 isoform X4 [Xiphias gladius]XP_039982693.1 queuine tRNA-ribosyltransferase accessory subunit 2 isoform X4 [Xiphias gladius]XP_039982694.1 queuine tRNA-ribosyltransferase accessory subunit 2 isoform X4 [Xiphias gladius]